MIAGRDRVVLAVFLVEAVLAGGNGVGVRFSNRELDPLWGAGLRFALAAVLLLAVMAVMRLVLPRGRALAGALLHGLFNFGAPSACPTTRSSTSTPGSARSSWRSCRWRRCCWR